jgi:hypothetical protein
MVDFGEYTKKREGEMLTDVQTGRSAPDKSLEVSIPLLPAVGFVRRLFGRKRRDEDAADIQAEE